jgi:hypothetical protein
MQGPHALHEQYQAFQDLNTKTNKNLTPYNPEVGKLDISQHTTSYL